MMEMINVQSDTKSEQSSCIYRWLCIYMLKTYRAPKCDSIKSVYDMSLRNIRYLAPCESIILLLNLICTSCSAQCSAMWSENQSGDCDITNHTSSCPGKRVIALIPVHTTKLAAFKMTVFGTHKVFRPAIRGCVAQDPPSTILCLPSKKSAFSKLAVLDLNKG